MKKINMNVAFSTETAKDSTLNFGKNIDLKTLFGNKYIDDCHLSSSISIINSSRSDSSTSLISKQNKIYCQ